MAQAFIDELRLLLQDDPTTSQWLLPLDALLETPYAHRFRIENNACYYLVYDDAFNEGEKWLTVREFYIRSINIVEEYIKNGYYQRIVTDIPTGG